MNARILIAAAAAIVLSIFVNIPNAAAAPRAYPVHTGIVSTTFWVGEVFNASAADGSQVCSTYDGRWAANWSGQDNGQTANPGTDCDGAPLGGCDGVLTGAATDMQCATERRTAANGFFPTNKTVTPRENPFYLDLPFDDLNDATAFNSRGTVIPWANDPGYAGNAKNGNFSYMKNRWVALTKGSATCYAQIEDAGPGTYHDQAYVFGTGNSRPASKDFNNAGMDVSPAANGCLKYAELDGEDDLVNWSFVEASAVPAGPWTRVVTTSQVNGAAPTAAYRASVTPPVGGVTNPSATPAPSTTSTRSTTPAPSTTSTRSTTPAPSTTSTRSTTRAPSTTSTTATTRTFPTGRTGPRSTGRPTHSIPSTSATTVSSSRSSTTMSPAPAGASVMAFDTTAQISDPNWFKDRYAEGFRLYIMHSTSWGTCNSWENTQQQLGWALQAGLKIAVYTRDPRCYAGGIAAAGPYAKDLQFFALDVESDPGVAVTRAMIDGVKARGVRPVVYSGSGMWPSIMNSSSGFSDVPLWDTDARSLNRATWAANMNSPQPVLYGGWNRPATPRVLIQQAFEVSIGGVMVDLNSVRADFLR